MRGAGEPEIPRSGRGHAVAAAFLGWALDAFDFFVVVFLIDRLALEFHAGKPAVIASLFATLAMRPVGALLFGLLADRYGRRLSLMANVVFFSLAELLCGFSPSLSFFLVMRALYGIGMGGEWGIGASLAMESVPPKWRGVLSGFLQSGYSVGYLLAALAARFILPAWGWRPMFWIGGLPALLAFYIAARVPESPAWERRRAASMGEILKIAASHWRRFLYLVLLMTLLMFLSHGTQDLYPDFLGSVHHLSLKTRSSLAVLYNVGAILGAIVFGQLSESLGRRAAMIGAIALALAAIPLWAFGATLSALAAGAFLMQAGVQGAWGVVPAHLSELSPDETRGLVPGLAYQLGILVAAPTGTIEFLLASRIGYPWALAGFEIAAMTALAAALALGQERKGRDFLRA